MASTDRDLPLKLRVAAIFRRMGYIVFNEVDLCTYTYRSMYRRKQITDFDVLGVRFEADFDDACAVAECKSAGERAMENLLKLNGVKELFGADKAYFVQQRIDENAREVGADLGIVCLDANNLAALLKSLDIREEREIEAEGAVYAARADLLPMQKDAFPKQVEYLRYDFWTLPEHRNVINLVRLASQMAENVDPAKISDVYLCHQLTTAFAVALLRLVGGIVRQNMDDVPDSLMTHLLGGSRERRDREVLHDTVVSMIPSGTSLPIVPEYFAPLAELTNRYVGAALYSYQIVSCLDEMGRDVLLAGHRFQGRQDWRSLPERTVKLARDAIHFLISISKLPKDVFRQSLSDGQQAPVKGEDMKRDRAANETGRS